MPYLDAGAGLRNGEACALDWADFDLGSGTLRVGAAKTDAGVRQVDLSAALRGELADHKQGVLLADGIRPVERGRQPALAAPSLRQPSLRLGDDPVYVAAQLGHTEPGFSMKVYASAVRRRERLVGVALREFDAALEWAAMGRL